MYIKFLELLKLSQFFLKADINSSEINIPKDGFVSHLFVDWKQNNIL